MTNALSKNVSTMVLKKFLPGFMDDRVLLKTVDTQLLKGAITPSTGDSVQFKRPHQYEVQRDANGTVLAGSQSPIVSATATAKISDYITVFIAWEQLEQAIELNQLDEILAPARDRMITEFENELAIFMLENAGLSSGDPDLSIDAWGDVAGTGSLFKALGIKGEMFAAMNPFAVQDLANAQSGLAGNTGNLVTTAWEDAQISQNFGGVRAFTSNSLDSYTAGTAPNGTVTSAPIVTYAALKDTYQVVIPELTLGTVNNTLKKGQQIQFDDTFMLQQQNKTDLSRKGKGVPFVGTVLADSTSVLGVFTDVILSGAPIFDDNFPQYNTVSRDIEAADTVTVLGTASTTYQPGIAYTKGYVGVGTVDLPPLQGWDSTSISMNGVGMRATKFSDPLANTQSLRLDLLPSFCVFNPFMGMQFNGNA